MAQNAHHLNTPSKNALSFHYGENIKTFIAMKAHVTDVNNPRITELAMIAVHALDLNRDMAGDAQCHAMPRIADKLVMCFNSGRQIQKHQEAKTKLSSHSIDQSMSKPFGESSVHILYNFLSRQERPICLIAHNGYQIDFRVLKAEIQYLQMSMDLIDNDCLLCADSAWIFKDMDNSGSDDEVCFSVLDLIDYSFESLYLRFMGTPIEARSYTAESQASKLLEILLKKCGTDFLRAFSCRKFSTINSKASLTSVAESLVRRSLFPPQIYDVECSETKSFIFLDLETTGLNDAAITELCMISIHAGDLTTVERRPDVTTECHELIPRILEKFIITVDPISVITDVAARISGITNHDLEERRKQPFTYRTVKLVSSFVARQPQPACAVAYNGINFDFKLMKEAITKCRLQTTELMNLFCADAIVGLRNLTKSPEYKLPSYRLKDVFTHLTGSGSDPFFHTAEGDTNALVCVVRLCPNNLISWLDQHKTLLMQ